MRALIVMELKGQKMGEKILFADDRNDYGKRDKEELKTKNSCALWQEFCLKC